MSEQHDTGHLMFRRTLSITAAAALTLTAGIAGYFAYSAHAEAKHQYTETRSTLTSAVEEYRTAHTEAVSQIEAAEEVLAQTDEPGAVAYLPALDGLREDIEYASGLAANTALAIKNAYRTLASTEQLSRHAVLPTTFAPLTGQLTSEVRAVTTTSAPSTVLSTAAVQDELARTREIVAVERAIAEHAVFEVEGSYEQAANELAALAGIEIVEDRGQTRCARTEGEQAAAFYCSLEPHTIYLIPGKYDSTDVFITDLVRHEIAHFITYMRCGDLDPAGLGPRLEAVTNSYASLFLGADRESLARMVDPHGFYAADDGSDAAARQIHSGCGV